MSPRAQLDHSGDTIVIRLNTLRVQYIEAGHDTLKSLLELPQLAQNKLRRNTRHAINSHPNRPDAGLSPKAPNIFCARRLKAGHHFAVPPARVLHDGWPPILSTCDKRSEKAGEVS